MLLAYTNYHDPKADKVELCLVPEKIDQFAVPLKVSALQVTENAVIRVSALEGLKVKIDQSDGSVVATPVEPAQMFLTPSYPDYPGIRVKQLKFIREGNFIHVFFMSMSGKAEWKSWKPNEM